MRSGVRSPSAPPNPPRVARFTRSPAAATARSKMTAIHFDRRGKLDDWSSDTFDHAQIGARLNDSHTKNALGLRLVPYGETTSRPSATKTRPARRRRFAIAFRGS